MPIRYSLHKRAVAAGGHSASSPDRIMDKRSKKKLEVLRNRIQKLRQQLAGAKKQPDEPGEVERLEHEIASLEAEAAKLKAAK
jgi:hypothetical protein